MKNTITDGGSATRSKAKSGLDGWMDGWTDPTQRASPPGAPCGANNNNNITQQANAQSMSKIYQTDSVKTWVI